MLRSGILALTTLLATTSAAQPYFARTLAEHLGYYDGFPTAPRALFSTSGSGYSILQDGFPNPPSTIPAGSWYVRPPGTTAEFVEATESSFMSISALTFSGARFQNAHWANDGLGYDDYGYRTSSTIDGTSQVFAPPADWSFNSCGKYVCWNGGWDWGMSNRRIGSSESGWAVFVAQPSIISFPHPTSWSDAAFARKLDGTLLHVTTYESCLDFGCSGISAARIDDNGNVYILRYGDAIVTRWARTGDSFAEDVSGGLSGLPGWIDPSNFFVLGDGSIIALGTWIVEIDNNQEYFPALFVKRPGQSLQIRVTPGGDRYLSAALSPFAVGGDGKKKIRWGIYCNSLEGHRTLYSSRSLPSSTGFLDWSDYLVQEATVLGELTSPLPSSGYEGEFSNWNAIDSLGRVLLVRHIDDRYSFDPMLQVVDRTSQIVRLEPAVCVGDLTEDGFVDDADFVIFLVQYDWLIVTPADPAADFNLDGLVDDSDFADLIVAYDNLVCE